MKRLPSLVCLLISLSAPWHGTSQTNWLMRPSNTSQNLYTVSYGGGAFLIGGAGVCLTSTNGTAWRCYTLGSPSVTSLAYCNGEWYGVGSFNGGNLGVSTNNGQTWTPRNIAGLSAKAIAYGDGTLVAVGDSGFIRYSADGGLTWNTGLSPTSYQLNAVTFGNGTWLAAGGCYSESVVTSADAQLWTLRNLPSGYLICSTSVGYGAGTFVVNAGDYYFTSSNDGVSWTAYTPPNPSAYGYHVAYGGGTWVAAGNAGRMRLSTDGGQTWNLQNSGVEINLSGVAYGHGVWVSVGDNGTIISSPESASGAPPLVPSVQIQQAIELDWQSQDGAVYQVQRSTNMSAWQDIGAPLLGDGQSKKFCDGAGQSTKRFYRIQIK